MKLFSHILSFSSAILLSFAAWSCNDKKPAADSVTKENVTSSAPVSSSETTKATEVTTAAETAETTVSTTVSETVSSSSSAETTAVQTSETTTAAAENKTDEVPEKGFATCIDAARAYYDAYLRGDPYAVYNMFCEEEIEGYHAYLDTEQSSMLDGKNAQVMFKRSKVISAINDSINRIHSIMAEKSDVPPAQWTASIAEQTLKPTGENELKDFNKKLGTSFTNASDCGYVYYKDGNEEHDFLGNGCGFVELDGRWYLSYSTVMYAELLTYMDIFR